MRFSKPSPAMVVAGIALFVSLGGTSIAAVSFARNAGAVDGKSAVKASASLNNAAGKLVATKRSGSGKGKIPGRFVANVPGTKNFGRATEVVDNTPGAPVVVADTSIGTLSATCNDQSNRAGVEDPVSQFSFANDTGQTINIAQRVGGNNATVTALQNGTVSPLTINGSNAFEYHAQLGDLDLLIHGVVRQDGRGSGGASCLIYGTVLGIR